MHRYSTSFGVASLLLPSAKRQHIAQIYGLVRLADEIVDGPAEASGLNTAEQGGILDALEAETYRALGTGFSSNFVVHAFAQTARGVGIDERLIRPFFASMRADLTQETHNEQSIREYIYGSAEVVGLMCVASFLTDSRGRRLVARQGRDADDLRQVVEDGACHLGAAFQKINFLRDIADDVTGLGRNYFPGVDLAALTDAQKNVILDDIDRDVAIARSTIPMLPVDSRSAVLLATELFAALAQKLRRSPAELLRTERVRLTGFEKSMIAGQVLSSAPLRRSENTRLWLSRRREAR
nr:squalene/phytoene synthase family protein [Lysinibacter cavernae]